MATKKIIDEFAEWTSKSQGRPITFPGGAKYYFWRQKTFDATDIANIESNWSISLPPDYRDFLMRVGAGQFFFEEGPPKSVPKCGVELTRIDDICAAIAASAEGPKERIFADFVPIGADRRQQSMIILGMRAEAPVYAGRNVPDRWNKLQLPEQDCLGTFTEWLREIADTYLGRRTPKTGRADKM